MERRSRSNVVFVSHLFQLRERSAGSLQLVRVFVAKAD